MALTKNREVDHYVDQELRTLGVAAAKNVFKGALVGVSSTGYARPLTAGDPFAGIAYEAADNSAGASGDLTVRDKTKPQVFQLKVKAEGANLAAIGHGTLMWRDFGVPDPSFMMVRIDEKVSIHFEAKLRH